MPARRDVPGLKGVWIDPAVAKEWLHERFRGRRTVAFERRSVVYFAQREDGPIKIGFSSDVMRRVFELRRYVRRPVELLACFPGAKPDELRLHERFAEFALGGEWYDAQPPLVEYIDSLRERAA